MQLCQSLAWRQVTEYTIDLDLAPAERFKHVIPQFNDTVWTFWNDYFAKDTVLQDALFALTDLRGDEVDELQQEVAGLSQASGLPLKVTSQRRREQLVSINQRHRDRDKE